MDMPISSYFVNNVAVRSGCGALLLAVITTGSTTTGLGSSPSPTNAALIAEEPTTAVTDDADYGDDADPAHLWFEGLVEIVGGGDMDMNTKGGEATKDEEKAEKQEVLMSPFHLEVWTNNNKHKAIQQEDWSSSGNNGDGSFSPSPAFDGDVLIHTQVCNGMSTTADLVMTNFSTRCRRNSCDAGGVPKILQLAEPDTGEGGRTVLCTRMPSTCGPGTDRTENFLTNDFLKNVVWIKKTHAATDTGRGSTVGAPTATAAPALLEVRILSNPPRSVLLRPPQPKTWWKGRNVHVHPSTATTSDASLMSALSYNSTSPPSEPFDIEIKTIRTGPADGYNISIVAATKCSTMSASISAVWHVNISAIDVSTSVVTVSNQVVVMEKNEVANMANATNTPNTRDTPCGGAGGDQQRRTRRSEDFLVALLRDIRSLNIDGQDGKRLLIVAKNGAEFILNTTAVSTDSTAESTASSSSSRTGMYIGLAVGGGMLFVLALALLVTACLCMRQPCGCGGNTAAAVAKKQQEVEVDTQHSVETPSSCQSVVVWDDRAGDDEKKSSTVPY